MATTYYLTYTDPENGIITVVPNSSNGTIAPISSILISDAVSADTSLTFYGQGHPNYGDAVQENFLHILENFAGATAPVTPVVGQTWFASYNYWKDTVGLQWYEWSELAGTWATVSVTESVSAPVSPTNGALWFNTGTSVLSQWTVLFDHPTGFWHIRTYVTDVLAPTPLTRQPKKVLKTYSGTANGWKTITTVPASTVSPLAPEIGDLWFDTSTNRLKVWTGSAWSDNLSGAYVLKTGDTMSGNLNMGGTNKVVNVVDPSAAQDVATKNYVDALAFGGSLTTTNVTNVSTVVGVTATNALNTLQTFDNSLSNGTLTITIDANSHKIINVTDPTNPQDVATKNYVDSGAASDTFTISGSYNSGTKEIALLRNDAVSVIITGIEDALHIHNMSVITFTPTNGTILDQLSLPPTDGQDAINSSNDIMVQRTRTKRAVATVATYPITAVTVGGAGTGDFTIAGSHAPEFVTGYKFTITGSTNNNGTFTVRPSGATGTGPTVIPVVEAVGAVADGTINPLSFTVPQYSVGYYKPFIFNNGVKQLGGDYGSQAVRFAFSMNNTEQSTGLTNDATVYNATITVNGVPHVIAVTGSTAQTFTNLITQINLDTGDTTIVLEDGRLIIRSTTLGATSTVAIVDGGAPNLFSSLTFFSAIEPAVAGFDGAYFEVGAFDSFSTQINFNTAPTAGNVLEMYSLGNNGIS